jgi:hypothetical protein
MNPKHTRILLKAACLLPLISVALAGCASGPAPLTRGKVVPWNVSITNTVEGSIEVDLFGVSASDHGYWQAVKMDEYWEPGSRVRKAVFDGKRGKTYRFEKPSVFVLSKDDPMWSAWSNYGSYELAVMTHLLGSFSNPEADPRRRFLKLGKKEWETKSGTIELQIVDGQVQLLTREKQ